MRGSVRCILLCDVCSECAYKYENGDAVIKFDKELYPWFTHRIGARTRIHASQHPVLVRLLAFCAHRTVRSCASLHFHLYADRCLSFRSHITFRVWGDNLTFEWAELLSFCVCAFSFSRILRKRKFQFPAFLSFFNSPEEKKRKWEKKGERKSQDGKFFIREK